MSTFSIEQIPGGHEHMANMLLPRIGLAYPNIFITIRYRLDPKTKLFVFKKYEDIRCYFSPYGWTATTGFEISRNNLDKDISSDLKEFSFKVYFNVDLVDAKATVRVQDSGIDFTTPHERALICIQGELDNKGHGSARGWKA